MDLSNSESDSGDELLEEWRKSEGLLSPCDSAEIKDFQRDPKGELRWVKTHLQPGRIVYLIDSVQANTLPSGYAQKHLKCRLVSLTVGTPMDRKPVWLRLKLMSKEDVNQGSGMVVDYTEKSRKGLHLFCSFRDLDSMVKHLVILDPIHHLIDLENPTIDNLKFAELVFENMWTNLYLRSELCPLKDQCSQIDLGHVANYSHPA